MEALVDAIRALGSLMLPHNTEHQLLCIMVIISQRNDSWVVEDIPPRDRGKIHNYKFSTGATLRKGVLGIRSQVLARTNSTLFWHH